MALTKVNSILVDGAINTDSSGNVGIGTSSPNIGGASSGNAVLTLAGTGSSRSGIIEMQTPSQAADNAGAGLLRFYNGTNEIARMEGRSEGSVTDAGRLQFYTRATGGSLTERMRIDSSGRVLVNATSWFGGMLQSTGIAGSRSAAAFRVGQNGDGALEWFNSSGGYVAAVTVNASTVAYGTSSDYRLKDNIAPMTGALDTVALLKPCTYTWKSDGSSGQGFIAHELAEVCPDAVTGEKDAVNEDGSIDPQGIDTSFLVATLTAAIQEQQAIITDLKARIETLEAK